MSEHAHHEVELAAGRRGPRRSRHTVEPEVPAIRNTDRWRRIRAACSEHSGLDDLDGHADRVFELHRIATSTPGSGSTVEGSSAAARHRR